MRNFLSILACAAGLWFSVSQAQSALKGDEPLPADRGIGEAASELRINLDPGLIIPASSLTGEASQTREEARGHFSFTMGHMIRSQDAEKLLKEQTATVCTVYVTGEFLGPKEEFRDFMLQGQLRVQDVFYETQMEALHGQVTAKIPIETAGVPETSLWVREIRVQRSYRGTGAANEQVTFLLITPSVLKSCFGGPGEVLEVPAGPR